MDQFTCQIYSSFVNYITTKGTVNTILSNHLTLIDIITTHLHIRPQTRLWNQLPSYVKQGSKVSNFPKKFKTFNFWNFKARCKCNYCISWVFTLYYALNWYIFVLILTAFYTWASGSITTGIINWLIDWLIGYCAQQKWDRYFWAMQLNVLLKGV